MFHGGPGMHMRGPGGPGGPGLLAAETLKTAAGYLGIPVATLAADLKAGKTLAEEATAKGKTPAGLITALKDNAKGNLDVAVSAGLLTQAQADNALDAYEDAVTELVNNGPGIPRGAKHGPLEQAATYLGISVSDLATALKNGKTLAQVAADKGKTVEGLVTALTADAKKHLDAAVSSGDITQAQANAALKKLTDRVTDMVNGTHGPKAAEKAATTATKMTIRFVALHR